LHSKYKRKKFKRSKWYYAISAFFLIPFFYAASISADESPESREYPLVISVGAHTLSVPWYPGPITENLNPAISGGTEYTLKNYGNLRLYQTANLGFFQHYWWMSGVYVNSEFGTGFTFGYGIHTDLRLGAGYLHYYFRRDTLEFRDGKYVNSTDWGRPSLMVPVSLILGYRGAGVNPDVISPFVSMQWALQGIFREETPALSHLIFSFGARIFLW
jgi:hypothetical protein